MNDLERVRRILRDSLQLGARAYQLTENSRLLGRIPEFDSMAVVNVINQIESEYGITIDDGELSADVFETVGPLRRFVSQKTAG